MEGTMNWPLVEWRWCTLYFSPMWKFFRAARIFQAAVWSCHYLVENNPIIFLDMSGNRID